MTKIGLQLYNFREYLTNTTDIIKTLNEVKKIGYNVVQLSGIKSFKDEAIIKCIIEECQKLDLEICVTHIPLELLEEDFKYVVKLHKSLGCHYVGLGSIEKRHRENPSINGFIEYAKKIEQLAIRLETEDLKLVYHNHEFEFMKIQGISLFDLLVNNTKKVLFEIDTHWIQRGGYDPVKVLQSLAGRIDIIHLKDYAIFNSGKELRSEIRYAEVGEGSLDFKAIIDKAQSLNCLYMLVEQDDSYDKTPFECAEVSFKNIVKMGYQELL